MTYYVTVKGKTDGGVTPYYGKSDAKAREVLQSTIDVLRELGATGRISYCHANMTGTYEIVDGQIQWLIPDKSNG